MKLNKKDKELIKKAKELLEKRESSFSSTSCALYSDKGNLHLGVNLDSEHPSSVCAEPIAIGNMVVKGDKKIQTIVAVQEKGIVPPCGTCRDLMKKTNTGNPWIIINNNKKIKLDKLLPY